jgi:hypothetical protein
MLTFQKLEPHFVAEVGLVGLRSVCDRATSRTDPGGDGRVRRPSSTSASPPDRRLGPRDSTRGALKDHNT